MVGEICNHLTVRDLIDCCAEHHGDIAYRGGGGDWQPSHSPRPDRLLCRQSSLEMNTMETLPIGIVEEIGNHLKQECKCSRWIPC
ncbi:hypothetical protein J6590_003944 [Homalodisca vitripennis]|nr:hypothetical protein J6590_003944 [Homalodisca vitripennis]